MSATGDVCTVGAGRKQELLDRVVELYEKDLVEAEEPQVFLETHHLNDGLLQARCRLGWSDGRLKTRLPRQGQLREELTALGLLTADGKEFFDGCLVVPVIDAAGVIRTLAGIRIEDGAELLLPSPEPFLWRTPGLPPVVGLTVCCGVLNGLSLLASDVSNAAAIVDTALGPVVELPLESRLLLAYGASKPSCVAACKEVLRLPPGVASVAALLNTQGAKAVKKLAGPALTGREGFPVLCGHRCYRVFGLERKNRKLHATVRLELNGKLHVDTLDLYQSRSRERLRRDLVRVFDIDKTTVDADVNRLVQICEQAIAQPPPKERAAEQPVMTPTAEAEALALGRDPRLFQRILQDFDACGIVGEESNKLLCYLALTSRKQPKPLSVLILSSSGSGKTALQDAALAFCPPEDLVKLTRLSGKALFYKEQNSLKHKVLAIEEGAGAGAAAYAIRCLISAETLTTESAVRDPGTGRLTTMQNTVEGPTAVFYTTTDPEVNAETRSRFLVTGVDESREQTRRILARQRQAACDSDLVPEREAVIDRHRNFQRLLKPVAVVNPLVDQLGLRDDRLQSRRLQPQYLALVHAVAFLRQFQKEVLTGPDDQPYITVDQTDVDLARELALEILGRTLDELTIPGRDLLQLLWAMLKKRAAAINDRHDDDEPIDPTDICFTRKDVREHIGWSHTRLHVHLHELIDLEYVVVDKIRRRGLQEYRLLYNGQGLDGQRFLPFADAPADSASALCEALS